MLVGCGLIPGSPKDREIVVTLPVSRAEAVRRTLATFREQGYRVRETLTSGSNPETEEFRHRDDADVVFRAAIEGSGDRSRIVFSGTYRRRRLGGLMHDDARAVRNTDDDLERELWGRLSNLALTLRQSLRTGDANRSEGDSGDRVAVGSPCRTVASRHSSNRAAVRV